MKRVRITYALNYETNATYKNKFGSFSVDALIGGNIRKNYFDETYTQTSGGLSSPNYFAIAASIARPTIALDYQKKKVNSIYGKASFGYKDMIFAEGTLRNDWSSALPQTSNSYLYPSVSTSIIFTELLKRSGITNWLTFGKLRASYASVGADLDPHSLDIAINNGSFYGANSSVTIGNQFRGGGIKPSHTNAWEVGTELRFFRRITFDATIYQNNNTDQILPIDVSPSSGFTTAQIDAGKIVNKGVELSLTGSLVAAKISSGRFH